MMDLFYAVFQNCFAMRDSLINSGVDENVVSDLFQSEPLRLCRDIANGTKHCEITRASVDSAFVTLREYDPLLRSVGSNRTEVFRLLAAGRKYDLFGLALNCMCEIQGFLIREQLIFEESKLLA
jgi:hypothetical protein